MIYHLKCSVKVGRTWVFLRLFLFAVAGNFETLAWINSCLICTTGSINLFGFLFISRMPNFFRRGVTNWRFWRPSLIAKQNVRRRYYFDDGCHGFCGPYVLPGLCCLFVAMGECQMNTKKWSESQIYFRSFKVTSQNEWKPIASYFGQHPLGFLLPTTSGLPVHPAVSHVLFYSPVFITVPRGSQICPKQSKTQMFLFPKTWHWNQTNPNITNFSHGSSFGTFLWPKKQMQTWGQVSWRNATPGSQRCREPVSKVFQTLCLWNLVLSSHFNRPFLVASEILNLWSMNKSNEGLWLATFVW